jgi:hypothetical protein
VRTGGAAAAERHLDGLRRALQVGRDDQVDAVVAPAPPELTRTGQARPRQLAREPAGGDPGLVVDRRRVRLVD